MINRPKYIGIPALGAILLAYCGCSQSPSRIHPPEISPTSAGQAAMREYDANKDGKVSGEELQKAPSLLSAIGNLDKDGDKAVTADEVAMRIKAWQATNYGQMMKMVTVKYQGRPLAGANVVFEPEAFLGTKYHSDSGTTDENGMTVMQTVAPGLYKVKITKEGMNLPAEYNTQTTLGAEVAEDAKDVAGGAIFHLK